MRTGQAWFWWALLSAGFAALTTIFAKVGLQRIDADMATWVRTGVIWLLLSAFVVASGKWANPLAYPTRAWVFLVLSGFAAAVSWVCYFRALQQGDAAQVAPIDKASVLLLVLFAYVFLGERPAPREWLGVGLIGTGLVILGWR